MNDAFQVMQQMSKSSNIEFLVCQDIKDRQRKGISKYGTTVADNPLSQQEWITHAYEETLDLAVYLKKLMELAEKPTCDAVNHADKLAGALRNALNMIDPFVWDKSKEAAILEAYEAAQ